MMVVVFSDRLYFIGKCNVRTVGRAAYVLIAVGVALSAAIGSADVFHGGSGMTSLQMVPVGNAGNAANPETGLGAVAYSYYISKYDVTIGQYCEFLNAVAKTDTYGLYNGYGFGNVGITRSGSSGNYTYSVSYDAVAWNTYCDNYPNRFSSALAAASDCPITGVSWGDAARFCNWLANGQPTGAQGNSTTEMGAYMLFGDTTSLTENRILGATWYLPSQDEWYKAAHYNPSTGAYWKFPTQSDAYPTNVLSATGTNNANYRDVDGTGNGGYSDPINYLTPVGAFSSSPGPYGTYDMGGDVWQWTDTKLSLGSSSRRLWGGAYNSNVMSMSSSVFITNDPRYGRNEIGFRVAGTIPEPGSLALLLSAALGLLACAWQRARGR
jgi:formylglycine-generating enzyme